MPRRDPTPPLDAVRQRAPTGPQFAPAQARRADRQQRCLPGLPRFGGRRWLADLLVDLSQRRDRKDAALPGLCRINL